jgi:DNA (cytosine-5)-methyltransferase 1
VNDRPRLLDLFSGAGGAAMGYHRAGFEVVGVDSAPQPNYPFRFVQADALLTLEGMIGGAPLRGGFLEDFAAIHASPPCQAHSTIGKQARGRDPELKHADLVGPTRELLIASGLPYVIENVPGAPLINPVQLCGSWFGLNIRRHRLFETNWPLLSTPCSHHWQIPRFRSLDQRRHNTRTTVPIHGGSRLASVVGVHGHINYAGEMQLRAEAMGIDWMTPYELTQAIPPAYTALIGEQLMPLASRRAARLDSDSGDADR